MTGEWVGPIAGCLQGIIAPLLFAAMISFGIFYIVCQTGIFSGTVTTHPMCQLLFGGPGLINVKLEIPTTSGNCGFEDKWLGERINCEVS